MIRYIGGFLEIHGLSIKTEEELREFIGKMKDAIRSFTDNEADTDVDFELEETAGTFEK